MHVSIFNNAEFIYLSSFLLCGYNLSFYLYGCPRLFFFIQGSFEVANKLSIKIERVFKIFHVKLKTFVFLNFFCNVFITIKKVNMLCTYFLWRNMYIKKYSIIDSTIISIFFKLDIILKCFETLLTYYCLIFYFIFIF